MIQTDPDHPKGTQLKTLEAYDIDKIPLTSFQTFSRVFHSAPKLVWEFYRLLGFDASVKLPQQIHGVLFSLFLVFTKIFMHSQ